jgi:hypothetical protein
MASETVSSLILGLSGLLVGAWGMWLTHRSQALGLQQILHQAQLDAALEITATIRGADSAATVLRRIPLEDLSMEDRRKYVRDLDRLRLARSRYSALLPEGVLVALEEYTNAVFEKARDEADSPVDVWLIEMELEQLLRSMVGVEPLSERTRQLLFPRGSRGDLKMSEGRS